MYNFRAHIGVLMNITPDHLDRYDHCFQNYVDAKMRITQNMTSRDWFVYSGDDEVIREQLPKYDLRMKPAAPSRRRTPWRAARATPSSATGKFIATAGKASVEIDTAKLRIRGFTTPTTPWPRRWPPSPPGSRGADSHVALRLRARRAPPGARAAERRV